ncbi:MAG: magnesium-translocating P-type ATPase [Nitrososphaeraceae archaeon]
MISLQTRFYGDWSHLPINSIASLLNLTDPASDTMTHSYYEKEFWNVSAADLVQRLCSDHKYGLTSVQVKEKLTRYGKNLVKTAKKKDSLSLLLSQFKSPIIIIFIFTSAISFFIGEEEDALIIIVIVIISGILGFWQEKGATDAVDKLLAIVKPRCKVIRDGKLQEIPSENVFPGDLVVLKSGDSVPADCLIMECKDLFVNEATLTGESYPSEKSVNSLSQESTLRLRTNSLFQGTFIVSGTATALVARTGANTELGNISERLKHKAPETEFEHGVKRFGYFLLEITLMLVISILVINIYFHRPVLDSFLFSLALAIGLTPQLLPAIISVNLAHGAKRMAAEKVIVKRLASIENLGSMNILCSDKTGTLTTGEVKLHSAINIEGNESEKVLLYAYLNAFYETGFVNPIDKAIKDFRQFDTSSYLKLDELPYDFIRKRLTIFVSSNESRIIVTKGALHNVLSVCSNAESASGQVVEISKVKEEIQSRFEELGRKGFRVLGVSYRLMDHSCSSISKEDEIDMTFAGFIVLFDPVNPGVTESISALKKLGISLKLITGDNKHVAAYVGRIVGLSNPHILVGSDLNHISTEALTKLVNDIDIFAEIEPNQKERIILALRRTAANVVGYMGDGINDSSALHAADAGISVDTAADVLKEAADIVLLEKDLGVLVKGVQEGRRTFANTLKYVFMATSANFGNMFSMAGASLFLPFLPLLPKQILLVNLMTDLPEMTISTDNVDPEIVEKPRRWDLRFISKFMLVFGLLSTVFDYITFAVLIFLLHANTDQFRTAWFTESIISAAIIVLVIRTRRPLFKSRPRKYLLLATLVIVCLTLILPITPLGQLFELKLLSVPYLAAISLIVLSYVFAAEVAKKIFYIRVKF